MPSNGPVVPFGHDMLREHFLIEDKYINLNHGSFGSTVRPVRDALRGFQDASERAPDRYIRYEYPALLDASRAAAAAYLGVPADDVVVVPNVTTALNAVLRNLAPSFREGDVILHVDTVYGATLKTIEYVAEISPVEAVRVEFELPGPGPGSAAAAEEQVLGAFRGAFAAHRGRIRVAVFDTIASLPGVRLPFEEMQRIAREEGAMTLVDGAHGMGHFPLNLKSLDPDFFTTNCHKWLYTPRGCAVLYVPRRNQHLMRSSLPTSHWYEPVPRPGKPPTPNPLPPSTKSNFVQQFEFVGTVDNASLLCIPAAIDFRREVCGGEEAIMQYCWDLAAAGGAAAARILGTEIMDDAAGSLTRQCAMVTVRLPIGLPHGLVDADAAAAAGLGARAQSWMCEEMASRFHTFIAITFYKRRWWARFSAQIYLEVSDFEWGARVLARLCAEAPGALGCELSVEEQIRHMGHKNEPSGQGKRQRGEKL